MNFPTTPPAPNSNGDNENSGNLLLSLFLYGVLFLGAIVVPKLVMQRMFANSMTQQLEERVLQDLEHQRANTFVPDAPKNIRF